MDDTAAECVREYYRALDEHDYDALDGLLSRSFVHERPDRTLDGRDRFVRFMRDERPKQDTRHRVDTVYHARDDDTSTRDSDASSRDDETAEADGQSVAVRGHLLDGGEILMAFVDVFSVVDGRIERVDTYVQSV